MSHGSHGGGAAHGGHGDGHSHGAICEGHSHHGHSHGNDLEAPLISKNSSRLDTTADQRKLKSAVYCALFFMCVEIIGGITANSLAIITDAAHMLSDVGGFVVSLVALQLAAQGATREYTYGFKQAEVLGALLSITIVWALTAVLLWEAIIRFMEPQEIDAPVMFVISLIGFLVNLVLMQVLGHGHSHGEGGHGHSHGHGDHSAEEQSSIAVQAAVAHVIGDIVQSLGVCLASLCIWVKPFDLGVAENGVSRWNYADPCCTVMFGILVLFTTKSTLVYTIDSLMVKAPRHIDSEKMITKLEQIPGVDSIHDFHIWSIGSSDVLCTAHVMVEGREHCTPALQGAIKVANSMGIGHATFQIEIVGEFDPALETYGGLHDNDASPRLSDGSPSGRSSQGKGHSHNGGHGHDGGHDSGHSHDSGHGHGDKGHDSGHSHDGGACCGGHAH